VPSGTIGRRRTDRAVAVDFAARDPRRVAARAMLTRYSANDGRADHSGRMIDLFA